MKVDNAQEKPILPDTLPDYRFIDWEGDSGFGTIIIHHQGMGRYYIDSEALSLESLADILSKWREKQ